VHTDLECDLGIVSYSGESDGGAIIPVYKSSGFVVCMAVGVLIAIASTMTLVI
jgi:preprotein translocase subunit Sec61beta